MSSVRTPPPAKPAAGAMVGSILAFSVLVFIVGLLTMDVARADCIGPTFSGTGGDLAHGDLVTVTGYGFGDNCYDTGPPPPGEGPLGRPLTGIEVYLEQDGRLHLVAVGNANDDYVWELQVPIPSVLDVGEARLFVTAHGTEAFHENPTEIWVTSHSDEDAIIEPVTFGPPTPEQTEPIRQTGFEGTKWTPVIALVAAAIAAAGALVLSNRRSAE